MAITILETRKKQRNLIFVLAAIALVIFLIIWQGSLTKKIPPPISPAEAYKPPEVKIDWEVLTNPRLGELQPFPEISPWLEKIGRENPFLPF